MGIRILRCRDCAQHFVFTLEQQERYKEKGWEPPIRCPFCRAIRGILRDERACNPKKRVKAIGKIRHKNKGVNGWIKRMFPKDF